MKLFIDTCVWRHWLSHKNEKIKKSKFIEFKENIEAFNEIFELEYNKYILVYNARIEMELPIEYREQYKYNFKDIKKSKNLEKIPIPSSRGDGTYIGDGSILGGGRYGGTLKCLLSLDGYNHDKAFKKAKLNNKGENPAHTKPRKKEFDIEHLESALEANIDLFITTDDKLLTCIKKGLEKYPLDELIKIVNKICMTPVQALKIIKII